MIRKSISHIPKYASPMTDEVSVSFQPSTDNGTTAIENVMVSICEGNNPAQDRNQPTSTMTSALLRLSKKGYIFRSDRYEIEDPFFRKWILKNMIG